MHATVILMKKQTKQLPKWSTNLNNGCEDQNMCSTIAHKNYSAINTTDSSLRCLWYPISHKHHKTTNCHLHIYGNMTMRRLAFNNGNHESLFELSKCPMLLLSLANNAQKTVPSSSHALFAKGRSLCQDVAKISSGDWFRSRKRFCLTWFVCPETVTWVDGTSENGIVPGD